MTMVFRDLKDSITTILKDAEGGRYRTIEAQRQVSEGETNKGNNRTATVFYSQGDFAQGLRQGGPVQHAMTFRIELGVSQPAKGDLSVLNDDEALPGAKIAALNAFKESSVEADFSFDELAEIIFQIIMDGRNQDLGLDRGIVSGRTIASIQKDEPVPRGSIVILTGSLVLTCQAAEQVPGDIQPEGDKEFQTEVDQGDESKTGATVPA